MRGVAHVTRPTSFDIRPGTDSAVTAVLYAPAEHRLDATLVVAHGAGAGQFSPFIVDFAQALTRLGTTVVTFNFPYIEQRRRVPDRQPVLESCYRSVVETLLGRRDMKTRALFIGG